MADNDDKKSDKRVDEDWKKRARDEARNLDRTGRPQGQPSAAGAAERQPEPPGPQDAGDESLESLPPFLRLVSQLAVQASVHLGLVENPMTGQKTKDLDAAKSALETLGMLKEKTQGNLTEAEAAYLEEVLYSLRMGYVRQRGQ
jgi:hypothetical protein